MVLLFSAAALSAPISPIEGYQTTNHDSYELDAFWRTVSRMNSGMKGKDCFKRAMLWSYKLNRRYGVDSKKIFIHYTDKFNRELDDQGRTGIAARFGRWFSSNDGWDFHVAPAVTVNGKDYVLDPRFRKSPESVEDWVEHFTERGERLLKKRHYDLLDDIRKYSRKSREKSNYTASQIDDFREKARDARSTLRYLGLTMDPNQKVDIRCKKVTHIMEFDANQETEWCYYQEASQYYFGPLELRYLNYGNIPWDKRLPVTDMSYHDERYFQDGRNYVVQDWDYGKLEMSLDEFNYDSRPREVSDL